LDWSHLAQELSSATRIEGKIEGTWRKRKQLVDDLRDTKIHWKLKEEAQDRTLWRTRGGPIIRQATWWWWWLWWRWRWCRKTMICNFTLLFRSVLSGRDKMFDRDRFPGPVSGIFYCRIRSVKSRGEILYNFDHMWIILLQCEITGVRNHLFQRTHFPVTRQ
jgi:hypothetical protein